jgi:tetratricopeptide (TPR) repeat protein
LALATADGAIHIWDATAGYEFVQSEAYGFEQVHDSLNQATQLWEAGRKDEARALYEHTLEANKPKLGSFPRWVGMSIRSPVEIAGSTGQYQEAMELYQLLARLSTDESSQENLGWMLEGIGFAFQEKGQLDKAIALHREAIRLSKNNYNAHVNIASALQQKGQLDQAIAYCHEAIRLNKDNYAAHLILGLLLSRKGREDEAIASYREAIRLNEDDYRARNNLAWLFATCSDPRFRDIPQAVQLAQQAVKLDPRDAVPWNTLGVCLYRSGECGAAIEALEKAESLAPDEQVAFNGFFLAMAHWQMGHKAEARKWYDQAVQWMDKTQPKNVELNRFRAEAGELLGIKATRAQ